MQIIRRRGLINLLPFSKSFFCTSIEISKQAIQHSTRDIPSKIIHRIKPLMSVIEERNRVNIRNLFDEKSEEIFVYGMDPEKFHLQYFVYLKFGYWQHNDLNSQKLNNFIEQMMKRDVECQNGDEKNLKQLQTIHQYRTSLAVELLPSVASQLEYSQLYICNLNVFLLRQKYLKQIQINLILLNFDRIVFASGSSKHFENDKDNAWLLKETFNLFLDRIIPLFQSISVTSKISIILIARNLRLNHLRLMQYLRRYIQEGKKQLSLHVFLSAILFLGYNRSFPYEYFYKDKNNLMNFIQSAEALSDKKVNSSIILLQIFARTYLPYCQKILDRLIRCLQQNLQACDVGQLSRIFYYYSRLRSSPNYRFLELLIQRLSIFFDSLEQKHYQLIVKSLAALNYVNPSFLKKLQHHDYELFLASLRYGCQRIGPYYLAILQQVEQSYRKDPLRGYSAEDRPFSQLEQPLV